MKSPDNMALSSISLAEIIAGYPIAVICPRYFMLVLSLQVQLICRNFLWPLFT